MNDEMAAPKQNVKQKKWFYLGTPRGMLNAFYFLAGAGFIVWPLWDACDAGSIDASHILMVALGISVLSLSSLFVKWYARDKP